ncbi:hypothetical protein Tco_0289375 [Tanacetum coccineum]
MQIKRKRSILREAVDAGFGYPQKVVGTKPDKQKYKESAAAKPHQVNAPNSSRNSHKESYVCQSFKGKTRSLVTKKTDISYVRSSRNSNLMNMLQMTFGQNSSSLVLHQMTLDHSSSSLGPHCLMMSVHISSSLGPHCLMMSVHISSGLVLHLDVVWTKQFKPRSSSKDVWINQFKPRSLMSNLLASVP